MSYPREQTQGVTNMHRMTLANIIVAALSLESLPDE